MGVENESFFTVPPAVADEVNTAFPSFGVFRWDIDSLGLNNRVLPMKNYFMHSNGILDWGTFIYGSYHPWIDPYSQWGNGVLAFFYPPLKTGIPPSPGPACLGALG